MMCFDFRNGEVKLEERRKGLEILGSWSPMLGKTTTEFQHRLNTAWNAFWSHRAKWDCRMGTRMQRVKMLEQIIPERLAICTSDMAPDCERADPTKRCSTSNADDGIETAAYLDGVCC